MQPHCLREVGFSNWVLELLFHFLFWNSFWISSILPENGYCLAIQRVLKHHLCWSLTYRFSKPSFHFVSPTPLQCPAVMTSDLNRSWVNCLLHFRIDLIITASFFLQQRNMKISLCWDMLQPIFYWLIPAWIYRQIMCLWWAATLIHSIASLKYIGPGVTS